MQEEEGGNKKKERGDEGRVSLDRWHRVWNWSSLQMCKRDKERKASVSDKVDIKDVEFRVTSQSFWFMDEGDG